MWRPVLLGCLSQCSTKCAEHSRWSRPSIHFLGVTLLHKTLCDLGEEILGSEWLQISRVFSTYVLNAWCCSPKRSDAHLTKGHQTALWGWEISVIYCKAILPSKVERIADPSGRAVWGLGLRPLAGWDCGFEFGWGMNVCLLECCVLSGRSPCDGLIPSPEESYWVCVCVTEWDQFNNNLLHLQ